MSAATCESLASLTLPNTTITLAQSVAAGAFAVPGAGAAGGTAMSDLPAFCRVAATLKPSSDSDIKIEVWLPAANWNGKFQAVGNGGWAGAIAYPAMADALRRGYATSSTDTGHTGGSASFALGHPEKLIDFALPLRTRDDGEGQGDRQRVLRQRAEVLVLERLLDGRPAGAQGSAACTRTISTASSPARRASTGRDGPLRR